MPSSENLPAPSPDHVFETARALFADSWVHEIGAELEDVQTGAVEVSFRPPAKLLNAADAAIAGGAVHGGIIASLLDEVGCLAVTSINGIDVATVNLSIAFLAPSRGERFLARGSTVRVGRRIAFSAGSLYDDGGQLTAIAALTTSW
jgi:uncharacterized protein (TIGR00369 family)